MTAPNPSASQLSFEPLTPDTRLEKTEAGRGVVTDAPEAIGLRERQIVVMCNGVRRVGELMDLFGPPVQQELAHLIAVGLVRVTEQSQLDFATTLPPRLPKETPSDAANSTLFMATDFGAFGAGSDALAAARARGLSMLAEIGGEAAAGVAISYASAQTEDEVLALLANTIVQASRRWGDARGGICARELAGPLPRALVGRLIDRLLDVAGAPFVARLYADLLSV